MKEGYMSKHSEGVKVMCVGCKTKKTLTFDEASKVTDCPFCDKCGMPMVTVSAASESAG